MTTLSAIVALLGGWRATAFAALLILATGLGLWWRADAAVAAKRAAVAEGKAKATAEALRDAQHALTVERQQVQAANDIAAKYEKDKTDAQARATDLARQLRDGSVRLQRQWRCEAMPQAAPGSGQPDGAADDRAESASRAIGAADAADAQIRALQDLLRQERK